MPQSKVKSKKEERWVKTALFYLRDLKETYRWENPVLIFDEIDLSNKTVSSMDQLERKGRKWAVDEGYNLGRKTFSEDIRISKNSDMRKVEYSNGFLLEIVARYYW